jgi:hypothetical protein
MTEKTPSPPIYVRQPSYVGEGPFQNDLFNRKALAEALTGYINRTKDGCVLGLDAPWGEGKTWFGRNWRAMLEADGYQTIYLDAFEQDYSEDPFTVLAAEILQTLAAKSIKGSTEKLRTASVKLGKTLLPAAAKIGINTLGKLLLGTQDLTDNINEAIEKLDEKIADAAEKYIESRLSQSDSEKKSVTGFRTALAEFAAAQDKPVVFFIDELDRCRPDFAVRIVERVKHFFDVPNLVFVLLLNREQLLRAIEGVYGSGFDANAYLGKFIHLFLTLPKKRSIETDQFNATTVYAWSIAKRYNFQHSRDFEIFVNAFGQISAALDMSLRDVEKAIALVAFAGGVTQQTHYLAWPIVLKLKYPELFRSLLSGDRNAHQEAINILEAINTGDTHFWLRDFFLAVHHLYLVGREALNDEQKRAIDHYSSRMARPDKMLELFLKRIDIALLD